jgi:hypothetical protein
MGEPLWPLISSPQNLFSPLFKACISALNDSVKLSLWINLPGSDYVDLLPWAVPDQTWPRGSKALKLPERKSLLVVRVHR